MSLLSEYESYEMLIFEPLSTFHSFYGNLGDAFSDMTNDPRIIYLRYEVRKKLYETFETLTDDELIYLNESRSFLEDAIGIVFDNNIDSLILSALLRSQ